MERKDNTKTLPQFSKSCKFCLSTKNKYHYFMPILYMKYECYVIMLLDKTLDEYYLGLWNKISS